MSVAALLTVTIALVLPGTAAAHSGHLSTPSWNFEPLPAFALTLSAIMYGVGVIRLKVGVGGRRFVDFTQIAAMATGLSVLAITLMSPLHALADRLVSAHMIQHLLLMLMAPPLIVWARPVTVSSWGLPRRVRKNLARAWIALRCETLGRIVRRPVTAWLLFSGSIAFWHLPAFYRMALDDEGLHALMHVSFFAAGLLFWSVVLEPSGKRRLDYGRTILFVFSTAMVTGLPGALLSFARRPIYHQSGDVTAFGLTPLQDQQLAGLIMWIPMDLVLFGVAGALFVAWLSGAERRRFATAAASTAAPLMVPLLLFLSGCGESGNAAPRADQDNRESRGAALITQYGCGSCHEIPSIPGANGLVGPPLERFGRRIYIAGMLRNSPDNLVRWLRDPQAIVPGNAMPDMHMGEADARDIAAYLLALE